MLNDVLGQDRAVTFLQRVVTGHFSSPLLLFGEEGVGRRFSVMQMTREIFCVSNREPNCKCFACRQLSEGTHTDFVTVTGLDDKDIGVDQIRALVEDSDGYPATAPYKIFLVDGVDRMTSAAANALLKTLEEPPNTTRFFLLAEDASRVIPTIRSRCAELRYNKLKEDFVIVALSKFESNPIKTTVFARMAEGSMGRAIQYWGSGRLAIRDKVVTLLEAAVAKNLASVFSIILGLDKELELGLKVLNQLLHDLFILRYDPNRMIHLDAMPALVALKGRMSDEVRQKLSSGLKMLNAQNMSRLNLPFHVQTLFVTAFFGS